PVRSLSYSGPKTLASAVRSFSFAAEVNACKASSAEENVDWASFWACAFGTPAKRHVARNRAATASGGKLDLLMAVFIFPFLFTVSISLPLAYFTAFSFPRHRADYSAPATALEDGQRAGDERLAAGWLAHAGLSREDRSGFRFY